MNVNTIRADLSQAKDHPEPRYRTRDRAIWAKKCRRRLKSLGINLRQFSEAVGCTKGQMSKWLSGRQPMTIGSRRRIIVAMIEAGPPCGNLSGIKGACYFRPGEYPKVKVSP